MYTSPRRTSLIQAPLPLQSNVCWRQPPPVRSATKVQVVSKIHWAYSSLPSTLQSIVYTRFALPIVISAGKKSEQINRPIYRLGAGRGKTAEIKTSPLGCGHTRQAWV